MPATVGIAGGGYIAKLGWITLPSGAITVDTTNEIDGSNEPVGIIWATNHSPQRFGVGEGTYSNAAGGWLPVPPELVAPDGLHYAYLHADGTIRVSNQNGQEAIIKNPNKLTPLAFTAAGVVLTSQTVDSNGLWLLDTTTQTIAPITPVAGNNDWHEVVHGTAWGVDSPGVLGYPAPTKLLTVSTVPGSTPTIAFTAPGGDSIALIATDTQGGVMIDLTGSAPGIEYLSSSGATSQPAAPNGTALASIGPRHHADAHGIWFIGQTGIFLFAQGSGLKALGPAQTIDIVPGGDCT